MTAVTRFAAGDVTSPATELIMQNAAQPPVQCLLAPPAHRPHACHLPLRPRRPLLTALRPARVHATFPPPSSPEVASPHAAATTAAITPAPTPAPPSPVLPPTTAYDPENMIASSSAGPTVEVLSTQSLCQLLPLPPSRVVGGRPRFINVFAIGDMPAEGNAAFASSGSSSPGRRSPPPPPPPTRSGLPPAPASDVGAPSSDDSVLHGMPLFPGRVVHVGIGAPPSSDDEYASGDLDSSSSGFDWQEGRTRSVDAWAFPGRLELTERLLFVFIEPSVPAAEVSVFIHSALRPVAPLVPVDILPSPKGAMILRCGSLEEQDSLRRLSPLNGEGSHIFLQTPEETTNRFFHVPTWLAFVAIADFPIEHWYEAKIKECFRGFCEVAEIDLASLTGDKYAPLRLLLEVNDRLEIPFEIRISAKLGTGRAGSVAKVLPIWVWPREYQLNSQGNLVLFFGPPPPSYGPSQGPMGPFSREL